MHLYSSVEKVAQRKGSLMTRPINHPYVLILACIYETVRQTQCGPTLKEIHTLLFTVYGIHDMLFERVEQITTTLSRHQNIALDQTTGRYYPNVGGVFLFSSIQSRIIPPQTMAQPQRR